MKAHSIALPERRNWPVWILASCFIVANLFYLYDPAPPLSDLQIRTYSVSRDTNAFYSMQPLEEQADSLPADPDWPHLKPWSEGSGWDGEAAGRFLERHADVLKAVESAAAKPAFKDPLIGDPNAVSPTTPVSSISMYIPAGRLALVQAELLMRQGNHSEAVRYAHMAARLGYLMQQPDNFFICWLAGDTIKLAAFTWMKNNADNLQLSSEEKAVYRARFESLADAREGLLVALKMETIGSINVIKGGRHSISPSYERDSVPWYLPYYYQPNRTIGYLVDEYKEAEDVVQNPCTDLAAMARHDLPDWPLGISHLLPNAGGRMLIDLRVDLRAMLKDKVCSDTRLTSSLQTALK